MNSLEDYKFCKICGQLLPEALASWALRCFERKTCGSDVCKRTDDIQMGYLCCDQAEYTPCVCARSYKCPVHGEVHVGTHD